MVDSTIGVPTKGYTDSLPKAQEAFRSTFNQWLEWARALPSWDLNHKQVTQDYSRGGTAGKFAELSVRLLRDDLPQPAFPSRLAPLHRRGGGILAK